jgi:hypothetical protein
MMAGAALPVRCVNCGGATDWLAVIGAIVAVIGVIVAVAAYKVATRSRDIAQESLTAAQDALKAAQDTLNIAQKEHEAFMKQLTARARFHLTIRVVSAAADGVFEIVQASISVARIEIRLANTGEKPAGPTTVHLLIPGLLRQFEWERSELGPLGGNPIASSETLRMPDGGDVSTQVLITQVPRVSNRRPTLLWATFWVDDRSLTEIPVRMKAISDDLPDDQSAEVTDSIVQIRWLDAPAA